MLARYHPSKELIEKSVCGLVEGRRPHPASAPPGGALGNRGAKENRGFCSHPLLRVDTAAYAALMRGHAGVANRVRRAEQILLSSIAEGELIFGFRNGSRYEENMQNLMDFLDHRRVALLPVSFTTADRFGRIAASLRRKGKALPSNDIWVAAHAMESGAELISSDRHFEWIDSLVWTRP